MRRKTTLMFASSDFINYVGMYSAHSYHKVRVCQKPMQDPDLSVLSHIKLYLPRLPALIMLPNSMCYLALSFTPSQTLRTPS
jgi:hypothetical protein